MTAQLPSIESIQDTIEGLEQLTNRGVISVYVDMAVASLRALLAAHEQEPVAGSRRLFTCSACGCEGLDEPPETQCHCYLDGAHWLESKVFTHPVPFPAVPDAIEWPAEKFCPAEYAGSLLWNETEVWNKAVEACREAYRVAMLNGGNQSAISYISKAPKGVLSE